MGVLTGPSDPPKVRRGPPSDPPRPLGPAVALAMAVLRLSDDEHRMHARERTLAAALATMDQPVLILGIDAKVQYANTAAIREYGYDPSEIAGLSVDDFVVASAQVPTTIP